ncbi:MULTISPECIES: dTDP-4-dehydrorhamnose reductase [unclassified Pseudoxanthomonas]|uniref:dTDP-4-dehydrorhamnose reductase n=1 Tax=unclassified Pseudoxanthomonas TaxID=2645906 RepID=UPI0008F2BCCA|nr:MULTISPECIES: dTDP-4-dehydrorhamnose reductase [unclassified Pseudoxanthomonas]PPJ43475.1 dTDP-4-dehydrorhamnose reductase [Pseudoxanthomonas sp. KAs_5_3]SFV35392.1 dTDP-4-dehydrorhamnose reductase [Pseudoxanthomonas sp. YR558]
MKVLILGGNGQVGHELRRSLAPMGEVVVTTRSGELPDGVRCEVADFDDLASLDDLVQRVAPSAIVNAAAYTAVDKAEDDADAAFRANAEAPGVLARASAARGIPFVHYSTDYVFDGQGARAYREDDPTAPLGVYGASKLAGEDAIRSAGGRHLILRTAWVYGKHGHNFMKTMLRLGADRDEVRVVADQVGTPTPAALIADVTAELLRKQDAPSGTFHLTPRGETSWHGFAEAIFEEAATRGLIARAPKVLPIATSDYSTRARRPGYSRLDIGKLEAVLGHPLPEWRVGLQRVFGD